MNTRTFALILLFLSPGFLPCQRLVPKAAFVPNAGQWRPEVRYMAMAQGAFAAVTSHGWALGLRGREKGHTVTFRFLRALSSTRIVDGPRLPGSCNFFLGDDPARWRTGLPRLAHLVLHGVYPGIDVLLLPKAGELRFDLFLRPWADPGQIVLEISGASFLKIEADGSLSIGTPLGVLRQTPPRAWETLPSGKKRPVRCRYVSKGPFRVGFSVPPLSPKASLHIDPTLIFSTYISGFDSVSGTALAMDPGGGMIAAGGTNTNIPTTPGAWSRVWKGRWEAYIVRFDTTGSKLIFSTFLGGKDIDAAVSLALDSKGDIVVTGFTDSTDFPWTPGVWSHMTRGGTNIFISKLDGSGSRLLFSATAGGNGRDYPTGLDLGPSGDITIAGKTYSTDFPLTPGAYQKTHKGKMEGFVFRCDPLCSKLLFSSYFGASGDDDIRGVKVDKDGTSLIFGQTTSNDFPTTSGVYKPKKTAWTEGFIARLGKRGKTLIASTFFGGKVSQVINDLGITGGGGLVFCGETSSPDFPTTRNALQKTYAGGGDAFVSELDAGLKSLVFSSFIGGKSRDEATTLAVERDGKVSFAGMTRSPDFPTTPLAPFRSYSAGEDAFVSRMDLRGGNLLFSSFLGGNGSDRPAVIKTNSRGEAALIGSTQSTDFPVTPNHWTPRGKGLNAAFLVKLQVRDPGLAWFGRPTPACLGPQTIYAIDSPKAGNWRFGLMCRAAPPLSHGFLMVGFNPLPSGLTVLGIEFFLDPSPGLLAFPSKSDDKGKSFYFLPIPNGLGGGRFQAQYVWLNTKSCGGTNTLSASNALDITIR